MQLNDSSDSYIISEVENDTKLSDIALSLNVPVHVIKYRVKKLGLKPKKGRKIIRYAIGDKCGTLTVISGPISGKWIGTYHTCKCECGYINDYRAASLKLGVSGCVKCSNKRNSQMFWQGFGEISKSFWSAIQKNAKTRNLEFTISIEYAWNLFLQQDRKCALSGMELIFSRSPKDTSKTASLDRIDSSKGYIEGNVQWIHKHINTMKWQMSQEEFLSFCKSIAKHSCNMKEV